MDLRTRTAQRPPSPHGRARKREMQKRGYTMRGIADELNRRKVPTVSGGAWHPQTGIRIVERLGV